MVRTRSQYQAHGSTPTPANNAIDRMRRGRRWIRRYKDTDTSHRHRLEDRQPKTQQVRTYTRRA